MKRPLPDILRTATFRLTFAHLVAFGFAAALLLGFVYLRTVNELGRQVDEILARDLVALLQTYDEEGIGGLGAVINRRSRGTSVRLYLLTDAQLERLAGNLTQWPSDLPAIDGQHRFTTRGADPEPDRSREAEGTVTTLGDGARLLIAQDLTERREFRDLILSSVGWALTLALLFGAIEGWWLSRFMLRRVDAVSQFSAGVAGSDLSVRLPVRGTGDEFDRLSEEINGLLDRIEELVTGQRELADNVAHDLRRPFTRLRGRLELLLSREHDLEACRRVASETIVEADGILQTFELLLRIAKADSGIIEERFTRLDLGSVVDEVIELYAPLAKDNDIRLVREGPSSAPIDGVRELLAQALANLVDNAIKFSSPGDSVQVMVSDGGSSIAVTVADGGPGIPAADRGRVVQRFVRLDRSRSRSGSGLGLTLVAAAAKLHEAQLVFEDNHPGLRATFAFPRVRQVTSDLGRQRDGK